jgi:thymidine kinase
VAKLYFRYGTVASAKTMNLLAVAHNYRQQGKRVLIAKPRLDDRFGARVVASRSGLSIDADLLLANKSPWIVAYEEYPVISCLLVDEAQFLDPQYIGVLRMIATDNNIPVICYGLRTDFQTELFPGSKRLFELADSIEEIKTTCASCNRKAIFNARLHDGERVHAGPQILLGADDTYQPMCAQHYYAK